jgi:hypothetical protein
VRRQALYNILIEFGITMKLVWLIKICSNETCTKVHMNKLGLSPLFFNSALGYTTLMVQENQVGMRMSRIHQLLAYAGDVNILVENIGTINKNKETLIDTSQVVVLKVNAENTK